MGLVRRTTVSRTPRSHRLESEPRMPINFPNKPGIVAYLTAGDPDLATTRDIALAAIDNGADVLELGVPFSDPLADGPVIQRASERAVARGTRLTDVLELAKELRTARPAAGGGFFFVFC